MFTEPVSSWTMSLKRRAPYMLLPAVIWWFGNVPLEHVSAVNNMYPMLVGRGLRTGTHNLGYPYNRMHGGGLLT